jgi:hypothetical protein
MKKLIVILSEGSNVIKSKRHSKNGKEKLHSNN